MRTLFVVGDYKQAIFRFQGTSPENFERAKRRVAREMAGIDRELQDLGLGRSFRSHQPVLDLSTPRSATSGHERFGLSEAPERHRGDDKPGVVALWPVIGGEHEDDEPDEGDERLALAPRPPACRTDRTPGPRLDGRWLPAGERRRSPSWAGRRHGPGPQAQGAGGADRRAASRPRRARRRCRPAAAWRAARSQGPGRGAALCRPAARRPQSRQPPGLAADRVEPGRAARLRLPRSGGAPARPSGCGTTCAAKRVPRR
jgi:hypothetical protein